MEWELPKLMNCFRIEAKPNPSLNSIEKRLRLLKQLAMALSCDKYVGRTNLI